METYDKGYLICGGFEDFAWLIKTDINGDTLWSKILKCDGFNYLNAIHQASDGGFLLCGAIQYNKADKMPYVLKLNACGEKEWCKSFYTPTPDVLPWAQEIKETSSGDILVLVNCYGDYPEESMHIFKLNADGKVIWKKPYCSSYVHPEGVNPLGKTINMTLDGGYLISGDVYWEDPWNPGGPKGTRSLFVLVDSLGNEKWVLPFGLNDTIYGVGKNVYQINNNKYIGIAVKWIDQSLKGKANELGSAMKTEKYLSQINMLIEFDSTGDAKQYIIVDNEIINPSLTTGVALDFERIDSVYVMGGLFGDQYEGHSMEILLDTNIFNELQILNYFQHDNEVEPYTMITSYDKKIISNSIFKEPGNRDISTSKLNLNLEYDTAYTGIYTYDSLCESGPPQSGFIFLDDCDIVTGTDIPSPEEYYSFIATIPINAYPNPTETEITLALQNTDYHTNMLLECYNIYGQKVHSEKIWKGQQETRIKLQGWAKGLYFAVVTSEGKVAGTGRFVRK